MYTKADVIAFLEKEHIEYKLVEHPEVHTIEDMEQLGLSRDGVIAKNLFLRDAKGKRYFLIVLRGNKQLDMKELQYKLESTKLSFASEDRLKKLMGLEKGAVTPFGLFNQTETGIGVYIDKDLAGAPAVGFHPNDNTATVFLPLSEMTRLLKEHSVNVKYIDIL